MSTSGAAQDECRSRHITLDHVTLHSLMPLRPVAAAAAVDPVLEPIPDDRRATE